MSVQYPTNLQVSRIKMRKIVIVTTLVALLVVAATPFSGVSSEGPTHRRDKNVSSLSCPPGFMSNGNHCVCGDWPDKIVICDEDSQLASIRLGYCMTYNPDSGNIIAGRCPQGNLQEKYDKFYYPLPRKLSELNDYMCGPFNSEGVLWRCRKGFYNSLLRYFTY